MSVFQARLYLRKAVVLLAGDASLEQRLSNAAHEVLALDAFLSALPPALQREFLVLRNSIVSYGEARRAPSFAELLKVLPHLRKLVLVERIVTLFQHVSELHENIACAGEPRVPQFPIVTSLDAPYCWDHLCWRLPNDADPEVVAAYIAYAQAWLPNLGNTALVEWIGKQGHESLGTWGYLPLARISSSVEEWSLDELRRIRSIDTPSSEVGMFSSGARGLRSSSDALSSWIRLNGTYPYPLVVFRSQGTHLSANGYVIPKGFVLVEGGEALSRVLNLNASRVAASHRVCVLDVSEEDFYFLSRCPTMKHQMPVPEGLRRQAASLAQLQGR